MNILATNFHLRVRFLESQTKKVWYPKYPHSSSGITCSSCTKWEKLRSSQTPITHFTLAPRQLLISRNAGKSQAFPLPLRLFLFFSPHSVFSWVQSHYADTMQFHYVHFDQERHLTQGSHTKAYHIVWKENFSLKGVSEALTCLNSELLIAEKSASCSDQLFEVGEHGR